MWTIDGEQMDDDQVATLLAAGVAKGERIRVSFKRTFPWWRLSKWPPFLLAKARVWYLVSYLNDIAEARKDGPEFKEDQDEREP